MDVVGLYSNIPHKEGLDALTTILNEQTNPLPLKTDTIVKLTDFILTHNYFTFKDKDTFYVQTKGTAMGTKMAPQYANLFMTNIENQLFRTTSKQPLFFKRYIDDCFIVWTHGEDALLQFQQDFCNINPSIKLTMEYSDTSVNFLDTTISITEGHLETKIYRKPTDKYTYLNPQSFHPPKLKQSIIYSQAIRYNRVNTNTHTRDSQLADLSDAFTHLGYSNKDINRNISKAKAIPRDQLLQYNNKPSGDRIPLVTTYNPRATILRKIAKDLQPILEEDTATHTLFPNLPIIAFRQPPNLKNLLVKSKLTPDPPSGTFPCNKSLCKTCTLISPNPILTTKEGQAYTPKGQFTCNSTGVIYMIQCNKCPDTQYVGETGQTLRKRMNGHRQDIREENIYVPIGKHFNRPQHTHTDMRITVLKGPIHNITDRRTREQQLIYTFDTLKNGLNRDLGWIF